MIEQRRILAEMPAAGPQNGELVDRRSHRMSLSAVDDRFAPPPVVDVRQRPTSVASIRACHVSSGVFAANSSILNRYETHCGKDRDVGRSRP